MLGSLQTGIQPPIREISSPPEAAPLSDATLDELLIADLRSLQGEQQISSAETGDTYANASVANHICPQYSSRQINRLESHLAEHGTFDIPIVYGNVIVDGITRTIPFVAATETNANHGEMSSMLYLRDHIQVARGFMELYQQDPSRYQAEGDMGRELLRSALLLMSTDSQLTRFEQVIEMGREAGQADWPQISLHFNDLDGNEPNGWRNKQDTLQMLGHLTFDAIDRRFIDVDELTERDKEFLGFLTPFLASVGFPLYENSGSWEEFAAVRTSVMAVETALLHKQLLLLKQDDVGNPKFDFLRQAYVKYRPDCMPDRLEDGLDGLVHEGLVALGQRLPFESGNADYSSSDSKYREADAALAYVLMYDLPDLLAATKTPIGTEANIMSAAEIEDIVLQQLDSLIDPPTGGMKRYLRDSYQRVNFHTHHTQREIASIKRFIREKAELTGAKPDLNEKQRLRDLTVPAGREATWSHPLSQLAAWAAKRSLIAEQPDEARRYRQVSTKYINQALRLVTGHNQFTAALQADGTYRTEQLPAYKLPECFITYQDAGGDIIVASPHTPLNWSTAMLREAIGLLGTSTRQARIHLFGRSSLL